MMEKTKIICVEDNPKLLKHWLEEFNKHDDFEVVFEADDEIGLFEYLEKGVFPDFLILDLRLHDELAGLDVLEWIAKKGADIKVVVCSNYTEEDIMVQTLALGARAFVLKGATADIAKAIRAIQQEGLFITDDMLKALLKVNAKLKTKLDDLQHLVTEVGNTGMSNNLPSLNNEQLRILKHFCTELTYKEIAKIENITEKDVERKKDRLCILFGAINRYDLVYKAAKMGV
jgi:DNA-binding NarL/FixJ family response regulator